MNDRLKMTKLLKISIFIIGIVSISGCTGEYNAEISIKEFEDIGNSTYFEITDDELKEYPELRRSISGEKFIESDYSSCELNSDEFERLTDFYDMKHHEYLFSIDMKFENNLNDNIIDTELMNTFESNGFPLSENYSIITSERNSWWIENKANSSEYIIWEINDELKVYKSEYIEYEFTKIGEHYYNIDFAESEYGRFW
ncbi:MAG: hypothetical protein GQ533_01425 [Methanosarcinaceae archaeon]|nr:hypothetical protein [Methanosarcinaceae archaeon]